MQNLITYAEAHLDTFHQRPLGAVDSLILSWMANLHFPPEVHPLHTWAGLPLRDLFRAELFPTLFQGIWDPERTKALFTAWRPAPGSGRPALWATPPGRTWTRRCSSPP